MDIIDIRRQRLAELVDSRGGKIITLAKEAKVNESHLSQILIGARNMGFKFARKLESRLDLEEHWLDRDEALLTPAQIKSRVSQMPCAQQKAWLKALVDALDSDSR